MSICKLDIIFTNKILFVLIVGCELSVNNALIGCHMYCQLVPDLVSVIVN